MKKSLFVTSRGPFKYSNLDLVLFFFFPPIWPFQASSFLHMVMEVSVLAPELAKLDGAFSSNWATSYTFITMQSAMSLKLFHYLLVIVIRGSMFCSRKPVPR